MSEVSDESLIGRQLGNYHLQRELGRGGMGVVYLAHELGLERMVALKLLPSPFARRPEALERFYREARAAASINHPNVITIHNVGNAEGHHYIAMEFIDGASVENLLRAGHRFTIHWALVLVRQVLKGLAEAHRLKIVHRDIKPANIMIDRAGRVKVLDFGIARVLDEMSTLTEEGSVPGTTDYMSPEQCNGLKLDGRSDLFSLGVVLYRLMTGRLPFRAENRIATMRRIVENPAPSIVRYNPEAPREIADLINRAMMKNLNGRFQSAEEMLGAIDRVLEGEKKLIAIGRENPFAQALPASGVPGEKEHHTAAATVVGDPMPAAGSMAFSPQVLAEPVVERLGGGGEPSAERDAERNLERGPEKLSEPGHVTMGDTTKGDSSVNVLPAPVSQTPEGVPPRAAENPSTEPEAALLTPHNTGDQHVCSSCNVSNEMPYLFCEKCGAPRVKLTRWRVLGNCTLALMAFMGLYLVKSDPEYASGLSLMADFFVWDWPVYFLYAFFYYQFMMALLAGSWRRATRVTFWFVSFQVVSIVLIEIIRRGSATFLITLFTDLPSIMLAHPWESLATVGVLFLLTFVPAYVRWGRKYGWVNAYRVVVLSVLTLCLVGSVTVEILRALHQTQLIPAWKYFLADFMNDAYKSYATIFHLSAARLFTIFLLEIFIFASIKGYAVGRRRRFEAKGSLAGQGGFSQSLMGLAGVIRQIALTLENMVLYLMSTTRELARALLAVIVAFLRELFVPTLAMIATCWCLYLLTIHTAIYLEQQALKSIGIIMAGTFGLIASAVIFLGCKTRYRWGRISSFYFQFGGWLLPNLIVFFMLISISLFLSSYALRHTPLIDPDETLPFRVGPLTQIVGGMLLLMVGYILVRKRGALQEVATEEQGQNVSAVPKTKAELKAEKKAAKQREREAELAEDKKDGKLSRSLIQIKSLAGEAQERLKGKPAIVAEVAEARIKHEAKLAQIRSLESMRESLAPDTYETTMRRHREELDEFAMDHARLQATIDTQYQRRTRELADLQSSKRTLEARRKEIEAMKQAGALDESGFKSESRKLKSEEDDLNVKLHACETVLGHLKDEATKPADA